MCCTRRCSDHCLLSPYAVTKLVEEIYAGVYARTLGYSANFNVFGPETGPYAAVIPKWAATMIEGKGVTINDDGSTSRDFCYVANAVQANLRAALADDLAGRLPMGHPEPSRFGRQLEGLAVDDLAIAGQRLPRPGRYGADLIGLIFRKATSLPSAGATHLGDNFRSAACRLNPDRSS